MLKLTIPSSELYDEKTDEFIQIKGQELQLEHSLVSISKWESKWKKPFLDSSQERTNEEMMDYIRCMTLTQNVNPLIYYGLTQEHVSTINEYINDSMTATWFSKDNDRRGPPSREKITSELIYYWMISLQIPMECQKWHLNRLLTLIRVCNIKNTPATPVSKKTQAQQRSALNAARRQQLNSKG